MPNRALWWSWDVSAFWVPIQMFSTPLLLHHLHQIHYLLLNEEGLVGDLVAPLLHRLDGLNWIQTENLSALPVFAAIMDHDFQININCNWLASAMVFNSAQVQLSLSFVVQEFHLLDNGSLGNGPETKEITFQFLVFFSSTTWLGEQHRLPLQGVQAREPLGRQRMGRAPLGMIMTLILMIMMTLVEMTAMMKGLVKSKGVVNIGDNWWRCLIWKAP